MLGTCAQAQVISTHQIRVDGQAPSARDPFWGATTFRWFGTPIRLDGARAALLLEDPAGKEALRRRLQSTIVKLSRSRGEDMDPVRQIDTEETPDSIIVTDGHGEWQAHMIPVADGSALLLFDEGLPPANIVLHIVQAGRPGRALPERNTICFTPGTRILTEDGPRPIEDLLPGDKVLTRDDGAQEVLWIGQRVISGARLHTMPHLRPVRIRSGALGHGEPEPDLIVSPGHQIMLAGRQARALWGEPEVLVRACDLIDDRRVTRDHGATEVIYIHLLFARHQILWANRVEVESFHPGDADLGHLGSAETEELLRHAPGVDADPSAYGVHARRCLTQAELAIFGHRGAPAYLV